jgi:mono/diheme cytochrome c family protein
MLKEVDMFGTRNAFFALATGLVILMLVACGAKDLTKPGKAVNMTGDPLAGKVVYEGYCKSCHGLEGTGGVANPGSADGTVPALTPIDEEEFGTVLTLDLIIEHGSVLEGENVSSMPAFGDKRTLKPQQISDVIAYILELNK